MSDTQWNYEFRDGEFIVSKCPEYTVNYRFTVEIPIRVSADSYAEATDHAANVAESIRKDGFHVSYFDSAEYVDRGQELKALLEPVDSYNWEHRGQS